MSTLPQSHRWLGTPDVMVLIAGVGLVVGAACGLIFGFGPNPIPIFSALVFGIPGMMIGVGLGALLYAPRWAISGALLTTILIATILAVSFLLLGINNAQQPAAEDVWLIFAFVVGFGVIGGAALGGLLKGGLEESRLERWRIAESQRIEKDRYWSFLKRSARHRLRSPPFWMEAFQIAMLVFLQVRFEFVAPAIAWTLLALAALSWISRRRLALSGYRSWRKAYGGPSKSEDVDPVARDHAPIPEMAPGSEPFLPYSVFASKRDFQKALWGTLFIIGVGGLVFLTTRPDGWIIFLCLTVLFAEPLTRAYHFWQREKRIAEDESPTLEFAHDAF